jgi:hypothetical protein
MVEIGVAYAMAARTPYLPAAAALRICSVRLVFRDAIFAVQEYEIVNMIRWGGMQCRVISKVNCFYIFGSSSEPSRLPTGAACCERTCRGVASI